MVSFHWILRQPSNTLEDSFNEKLSSLGWSVGVPQGWCLDCLHWCGTLTLNVISTSGSISDKRDVEEGKLCSFILLGFTLVGKFIYSAAATSNSFVLEPISHTNWISVALQESSRPSLSAWDCWDLQSWGPRTYPILSLSSVSEPLFDDPDCIHDCVGQYKKSSFNSFLFYWFVPLENCVSMEYL